MRIERLLLALLLTMAPGAMAQEGRVEVPITQVAGGNGRSYYFIPVTVGAGQSFQALLDSGSVGLRLLPGLVAQADVEMTGRQNTYGYATGSVFVGEVARARIGLGGASGQVRVQMIQKAGCRADKPDCPVARTGVANFRFGSEGVGGDQRARIGVGLGAADGIENPLALIGNGQWIIELPRPGDDRPGRLILNPAAAEMSGFTRVPVSRDGEAPGCVTRADARICGRVLPDTGGDGLVVEARQRPGTFPWPDGTVVTLEMGAAKIPFQVRHMPGAPEALHWAQGGRPEPRIAGALPLIADAVLFDARAREIGFKPR